MNKWGKRFWYDLSERIGATFIVTLIPIYVTVSNVVGLDWVNAVEVSASAAGLSALKGLLANMVNPESGASVLPAPPGPDVVD